MLSVDPSAAAFDKSLSGIAHDISHLQRRPAYTMRIASPGIAS
jgi:hypothetical protein